MKCLGDIHNATVILGYASGENWGHDSLAAALASYALDKATDYELPVITNRSFGRAYEFFGGHELEDGSTIDVPEHPILGEPAKTWDFLTRAAAIMRGSDRLTPLLVAPVSLLPTMAKQATRLSLRPIIAPGVPDQTDMHSSYSYERKLHHRIRTHVGHAIMRRQGRL